MTEPAGYDLGPLIGTGGLGRVYRAVHRPSGRQVAVKLPRSEVAGERAVRRLLLDEARAMARFDHPRIVELLDVGFTPDATPFLVMELVDGGDLRSWTARFPGWRAVARLADDVLDALAEAHAAGVVHGDLKPSNVLRAADGGFKLTDFGAAELLRPAEQELARRRAGTPHYMAPEQFEHDLPAGPWTDLYALGVILCEVLSGGRAFPRGDPDELRTRKRTAGLTLVPRPGLELGDELVALVESLTRPLPRERPRFAREVRERFRALASGVVDRVEVGEAAAEARAPISRPTFPILPGSATDTEVDRPPSGTTPDGPPVRGESTRPDTIPIREKESTRPPPGPAPDALPASHGLQLLRLRAVPVVGREVERDLLDSFAKDVCRNRRARLLVLLGEAGVGKSRIAEWLLARVERDGTMEGVAAAYDWAGPGVAGGLRAAFRRLLGVAGGDGGDGLPPAWRWLAPDATRRKKRAPDPFDPSRMRQWLDPRPGRPLPSLQETIDLAHAALRAVSRVRPVYLWLDDPGFSHDGALALVDRLLERQDAAVLMVVTLRAGTAEHPFIRARLAQAQGRPGATTHTVRPLDAGERERLLAAALPLDPAVVAELARAVDASPLLLLQLVYGWVEDGLLVAIGDGSYRLPPGRDVAALLRERPPGAVLAERLDAVLKASGFAPRVAEDVLYRAALLGNRFEDSLLRRCTAGDAAVDEVLDVALLHGLLRAEAEGVYRFEHDLLHEAFLERLARDPERSRIVRETARSLHAAHGWDRMDVAARAAMLLRDAGELDDAWEALLEVVKRISRDGAPEVAEEYLRIAREWLAKDGVSGDSERAADVLFAEAIVRYHELRFDEARTILQRAAPIYGARSAETGLARCLIAEAEVAFFDDRFAESERLLREEVLPRVNALGDPGLLSHALFRQAELLALRGDLKEALAIHERNVDLARAAGVAWRRRILQVVVADLRTVVGDADGAAAVLREVIEEAEAAGDASTLIEARDSELQLELRRGRFAEVRARLPGRRAELERRADKWRLTWLHLLEALVAVELDPDPALAEALERFVAAFEAIAHEDPFSRWGIVRLAERLRERGADRDAARVEELEARRSRVIHAPER